MKTKKPVLAIIERIDFNEYLEEKSTCPECKGQTLTRHIQKEPQQKWKGRWFVEYCNNENGCPHWDCGFLTKGYKPNKDGYTNIPDQSRKVIVKE